MKTKSAPPVANHRPADRQREALDASSACRLEYAGAPVKIWPESARTVFEIVPEDQATRFPSVIAATTAAIKAGMDSKHFRIIIAH